MRFPSMTGHWRCARAATACAWILSALIVGSSPAAAQSYEPFDEAAKEAHRARVDPIERDYLVDVGARLVEPRAATTIDLSRGQAGAYIQFQRALSARERGVYQLDGVIFGQAMRGHTYRVVLTRAGLRRLRADPLFRGLEPVRPADRLSRALYRNEVHPRARRADGSIEAYARFTRGVSIDRAEALLDRWGVGYEDRDEFLLNRRVRVTVTHGQALVLAEENGLQRLYEIPHAFSDDNIVAAALSNIDVAQGAPYNLDGTGEVVGMWESGNPVPTHEQVDGRITIQENAGDSDHAAHVSCTIMGDGTGNANALGMAPGAAMLHSYTSAGDPASEMLLSWVNEGIRFANHSWGTNVGWDDGADQGNANLFGLYNQTANDWDFLVDVTDLLVQKSAGNDGSDCDGTGTTCDGVMGSDGIRYHTIGTHGNAKNILTVGAVDGTPALTGFSSTGPTDDFRIKPDIVAKGDSLFSAWAQGVTLPNGCDGLDYCSIGGTSMSCPTTTGGVMLLTDQYRQIYSGDTPKADVIKAVVVNSAIDLGRDGPDYAFGHGLLDVQAGADVILDGPARILRDSVDQGDVNDYTMLVPSGMTELRLTAAWVDAAGTPDSGDPDLVNDVDLRAIAPNGDVFLPFSGPTGSNTGPATTSSPNSVDNVESIHVDGPQTGVWTIELEGTSVPAGPQGYALVVGAPFWLDTLPDIEVVSELTFDHACPGQGDNPQTQAFSIFNVGGGNLHINDVQLTQGAPDFELVSRPSPPFVLIPGSHIELAVRFDPQTTGMQTGLLEIQSNDPDEAVREIALSGLAAAPFMTATLQAKGDFGDVQGGHYSLLELQIVNQGLCDLVLQDLQQVSGSTEFTVGEIVNHPDFPITVFPGEHLLVPFQYEPTDFAPDTAVFELQSNDGKKPLLPIELQGVSSPPILTISGDLAFGEICPDEQPEKTIDVCNTGWSDLEVTSASLEPGCDDFVIVGNPFPATVSHDFCMPFTVRYTPTGVGEHECTLTIESNDPANPSVEIPVTGTTLPVSVDVPPDVEFPATVIQSVYDCRSYEPFPVTNNGDCPVTITDFEIVQPGSDYSVVGLPTLPVTLLPGEVLGEGQLQLCFAPFAVQRRSHADVEVTYISNDPAMGDETMMSRQLCGEAVRTGMRILVTENGVPIPQVRKIDFFSVSFPGTAQEELSVITAQRFVDLVDVPAELPCEAFQYHREWGGESDPLILQPGTYRVWVRHIDSQGVMHSRVLTRYLDFCDFEGDLVIDFDI